MTLEKRTNGNMTGTTNFAGHAARGGSGNDGVVGLRLPETTGSRKSGITGQAPPLGPASERETPA
jgi:hypothetical protein